MNFNIETELTKANRLKERGDKYLAFLDNAEIPFTNNKAEQYIRMIKAKQKISVGFRNNDYAKHFVKIRGFVSTMKKLGQDSLHLTRQQILLAYYVAMLTWIFLTMYKLYAS